MKSLGPSLMLVLAFSAFGAPAFGVPFSFEYNDTIGRNEITGLSLGNAAKVTVTLDNGNLTNLSQTWRASHLLSVTWNFNNGSHVTTFNAPFDGGLDRSSGNFMTDAAGTLTSVMTYWADYSGRGITADFTTTGPGDQFFWFLNGGNFVYGERISAIPVGPSVVDLTNVRGMLFANNWLPTAAIPEPSTMLLFGTGLLGLMGYSWRRKHQEESNT